jgi:DNA ligase-1
MSSPAKRRKKNDNTASPKATRSLDYFFGKQKESHASRSGDRLRTLDALDSDETQPTLQDYAAGEHALTDEELARQLQEEWNKEDSKAQLPATSTTQDGEGEGKARTIDDENKQERAAPAHAYVELQSVPSEKPKATLSLQSAASIEDTITSTVPFDESPLVFEPSRYIEALRSTWTVNEGRASYGILTTCFVLVNGTTSRIKIVDTLTNFLRLVIEADPDSLLPAVSE